MSQAYLNKLMDAQLVNLSEKGWYATFLEWCINSKYRAVKRVDKFLAEQLSNPSKEMLNLAFFLKGDTPYETVQNIEKWVYLNTNYKTDDKNKGMVEHWNDAAVMIKEKVGDCLKWDTKLLLPSKDTINIEDITIGNIICGKDGKFVKVLNKLDKGRLPTKRIILNNGSEIIATDDHKFILYNGTQKLCLDLQIGDILKQNKELELFPEEENQEYWYLKGIFIADGWIDHSKKVLSISGKDGKKKETQKEWVKNYCIKNNLKYYWHKRYITIKDRDLYNDFKNCGVHAINKHIDVMPQNKKNIISLLNGLNADSYIKKNGNITFGTISDKLKEQYRILYRMVGVSTHQTKVMPCRTQFGYNPIWRVYPRTQKDKSIKVIGILEGDITQVYDLEVEHHEIYLPENDCVIHNCEDQNILVYVLCRLAHIPASNLYCCIGNTYSGLHFWVLFFDSRRGRFVKLDTAFNPQLREIAKKETFEFSANKDYISIDYLFNELGVWRLK